MTVIDAMFTCSIEQFPEWKRYKGFLDRFGEPVTLIASPEDGMISIPRGWAFMVKEDTDEDYRITGLNIYVHDPPKPKNDEQFKILEQLDEHLLAGFTGGQIIAPTGFGKTWIGCSLIKRLSLTTLVVTTKTDEMENWVKHCKDFLGINAQRWHGDTVPDDDCEIAISLVQSVAKGPERYSDTLYENFGLVIFDECHRLGADFFVQACHHIPAEYRFGMSAQRYRSDGRERVIEAHIGEVIAEAFQIPMVPKIFAIPSAFKLPYSRKLDKLVEPTPGRTTWVDKKMWADEDRNKQILQLINHCYKNDRNLVVFATAKEHLKWFYEMCDVPEKDKDFYIGGKKPKELEIAASKLVIFATYKMGGQGTNYPWWDAAIFASPLADVRQCLGRILRELEGKKQPVAFDIIDPGYVWGAYAVKREELYEEYGAEVQRVNI